MSYKCLINIFFFIMIKPNFLEAESFAFVLVVQVELLQDALSLLTGVLYLWKVYCLFPVYQVQVYTLVHHSRSRTNRYSGIAMLDGRTENLENGTVLPGSGSPVSRKNWRREKKGLWSLFYLSPRRRIPQGCQGTLSRGPRGERRKGGPKKVCTNNQYKISLYLINTIGKSE